MIYIYVYVYMCVHIYSFYLKKGMKKQVFLSRRDDLAIFLAHQGDNAGPLYSFILTPLKINYWPFRVLTLLAGNFLQVHNSIYNTE